MTTPEDGDSRGPHLHICLVAPMGSTNAQHFSFGKCESIWMKFVWKLYHMTAYLRIMSPLFRVSLKLARIPRWLKWCIAPAVAIQKEDFVLAVRNRLLKNSENEIARKIRDEGFADVSNFVKLTASEIQGVNEYFSVQRGYDSQVPIQSSLVSEPLDRLVERGVSYISFPIDISLNNEVIAKVANSKLLRSVSDSYLGFSSHVYSVNTMLTVPSVQVHGVTNIHRDYDDIVFLVCFIYWTETSRNNGATYFIPGSHLGRAKEGIYLEGRAGSVFFVDSYGLHAGNKKIQSPRLATWIRFGSIPNLAYVSDKNYLFL